MNITKKIETMTYTELKSFLETLSFIIYKTRLRTTEYAIENFEMQLYTNILACTERLLDTLNFAEEYLNHAEEYLTLKHKK